MKVLYIGGTGRSGSTVLAQILGRTPGWFAGGELAFLWRFGLQSQGRCSCGETLSTCALWSSVFDEMMAQGTRVDADRMVALRRRFWSIHLPVLASRSLGNRYLDRLEEFPDIVQQTYNTIGRVSDSRVLVDTSKEPHYSFILRERTDLDIYFLHLVRDPRAIASSWGRVKPELGLADQPDMERRGRVKSAAYFHVSNLSAEMLWNRVSTRDRYLRVRYEDLVADPMTSLQEICSFVGEDLDAAEVIAGAASPASVSHTAWGNPNRFDAGPLVLRNDDRWRSDDATMLQWVSTILTSPTAQRYGYPS